MMASTNATAKVPERTCAGCREAAPRQALLHFVLAGDPPTVVPDVRHRGAGRGASTHARYNCLTMAVRNGGFQRAFKRELAVSAPQLATWAREQYRRRIDGLLVAAQRAGKMCLGTDAVREAMNSSELAMLVIAQDAEGRREELLAMAERLKRRCLLFGDKEHLGGLFGRASLGVVAVLHEDIATEIRDAARCLAELAEDA